jgi:hypothetical protein
MPHAVTETGKINRIGWGLGAFAALFGGAVLVSSPWLMPALLPAVGSAFAFDPDFLRSGGLLVAGLWLLSAIQFAIVFADGHWRPATRTFEFALTSVWAAALLFLVMGPRIFQSATTDQAAKFWIGFVFVFVAFSLVSTIRRMARGQ